MATGAISSAVAPLATTRKLAMAASAVISGVSNAISQKIEYGKVDLVQVGTASIIGAGIGRKTFNSLPLNLNRGKVCRQVTPVLQKYTTRITSKLKINTDLSLATSLTQLVGSVIQDFSTNYINTTYKQFILQRE